MAMKRVKNSTPIRYIGYLLLLLTIPIAAGGQAKDYPKDYFRNPLDIPIVLAGNFGECRPNHFHSGLDIKTNSKENYKVYAAAEGYVSRIRMDKGGFGHALYVTHPNGFTTVYAHLNDFAPAIQRYLKQKQYELKSWSVDLRPDSNALPVKKGQQIAWSGNTGGSAGPHLHFEIRDTETEHPVNPQLFGFEISDTRSPVPLQLSLYDLNQSIYEQQPKVLSYSGSGNSYTAPATEVSTYKLGIGVHVNDFMNGSTNTLNFYTARWFKDDSLQGMIRLEDISYDLTRYLHAYVDYKLRKQTNNWFQLLFMLPGNKLDVVYPQLNETKGVITLEEGKTHRIRIELSDAPGNKTTIAFEVKGGTGKKSSSCDNLFQPGKFHTVEHPNLRFTLSDQDLYDAICFSFDSVTDVKSLSNRYKIHQPTVPVHGYFDLHLKPNKLVPFNLRDKVVLMFTEGKAESGKAASFDNGWYKASVRNFGTYWLVTDTIAPTITPQQPQGADLTKAKTITFTVKENLTSVASFNAELLLNGGENQVQWLAFEPRGDRFFYTFDEHCPPGDHRLQVTVADENGNKYSLIYRFRR